MAKVLFMCLAVNPSRIYDDGFCLHLLCGDWISCIFLWSKFIVKELRVINNDDEVYGVLFSASDMECLHT